jgi:hypothetical protein
MKGFTALGVAALAFGLAGCNDYNNSIQYNTGPQIGNYAPTGVVAGNGNFVLTVNVQGGQAFQSASTIQWNGKKLNTCAGTITTMCTTFVDLTTLTATITADFVANPAANLVNVLTPQSGNGNNGLSNTVVVYVFSTTPNPVPTITAVTPDSAPACGSTCTNSTAITVTGTNFLASSNNGGSIVAFQDALTTQGQPTALKISSLSDTSIKATIPGAYLANSDIGFITVINPANIPGGTNGQQCPDPTCVKLAGGGTSNEWCFAIGQGICPMPAQETPAISQDGRYVAYVSQQHQILLHDTCGGAGNGCAPNTQTLSVAPDGTPGNAESHSPVITPDARYVAYSSAARNLVEGAPSGRQIYLRDTCIGADGSCKPHTIVVSTDSSGALNGTEAILPSVSFSGRFVAFIAVTPSNATKTTTGAVQSSPNSGMRQVFVRDTCLGAANCMPKTTRISMVPGDAPENGSKPAGPAISGLAKELALTDQKSATVFTPTVAVDDRVFLAQPK